MNIIICLLTDYVLYSSRLLFIMSPICWQLKGPLAKERVKSDHLLFLEDLSCGGGAEGEMGWGGVMAPGRHKQVWAGM